MRLLTTALKEKHGTVPRVLLLITSSDATNVCNWSGRSVYPVYMACGNEPCAVRNLATGKQTIGYIEKTLRI